jgi:hypothetical protein
MPGRLLTVCHLSLPESTFRPDTEILKDEPDPYPVIAVLKAECTGSQTSNQISRKHTRPKGSRRPIPTHGHARL